MMNQLQLMQDLSIKNTTKIVLLVMDGLGGAPMEPGGPTELEAARTPNLDALAARSACGLSTAIVPGVTPGSGPATWRSSVTTRCNTKSGGACWKRWASA